MLYAALPLWPEVGYERPNPHLAKGLCSVFGAIVAVVGRCLVNFDRSSTIEGPRKKPWNKPTRQPPRTQLNTGDTTGETKRRREALSKLSDRCWVERATSSLDGRVFLSSFFFLAPEGFVVVVLLLFLVVRVVVLLLS